LNHIKFVITVDELSVLGTDEPTSTLDTKGDGVPEVQEIVETSEDWKRNYSYQNILSITCKQMP
jgi:hypothetical protein